MCRRKSGFEVLITLTTKHDSSVTVQVEVEHKDSVFTLFKNLSWNSGVLMQDWPLILTSMESTVNAWHPVVLWPGVSPSPDKLGGRSLMPCSDRWQSIFGSLLCKQLPSFCRSTVPFFRVNKSWGIIIVNHSDYFSEENSFLQRHNTKAQDYRRLHHSSEALYRGAVWCTLTGVMELWDA